MPACPPHAEDFPNTQAGTDRTGLATRASAQAMRACRLPDALFPSARDQARFQEAIIRRIPPDQSGRLEECPSRCGRRVFQMAALRRAESELKAVPFRDARQ